MYSSSPRNAIKLCITIFALMLSVSAFLLPVHPDLVHASPSQSQIALNAFSSNGTRTHYSNGANGAFKDFAASGDYTLTATQIVGTDAHLSLLPDPIHPTFTFTTTTISGFGLSHPFSGTDVLLSADGPVSATGVAIKTSVFQDIGTALKSFANKADLLVLAAGGTVKNLVMTNVTLIIDSSLMTDTFSANSFHLAITTNLPHLVARPPVNSPSATPTPTTTQTPTATQTPGGVGTPTPTVTDTPTPIIPTPTPTKCPCILFIICFCHR